MANPISPFYTLTEQYLDVVEKGQRVVLDLVESALSQVKDVTPDQLTTFANKLAPAPADLDRGYAIVNRAVSLQQDFAREIYKTVVGAEAAAPAKPKRAAA